MTEPKYDRIEISQEARDAYKAAEAKEATEAAAEAQANAWKTAPGIEEKDPNGHFRVLAINPDVYNELAPDQRKGTLRLSYRKLAKALHPDRGGNKEQMRRVNEARDALSNKNQGPKVGQKPSA